jgi:hypothetical protein
MITDDGKEVLSKYLLGQAPAYATHIAIGCGAIPLSTSASTPSSLSEKEILDFEMLRVPISSRGFVEDNGNTKISLTAELPTENRYEITELGLWSAGANTLARGFDSRMIFNFQENWQTHDTVIGTIPVKTNLGTSGNIDDGGDKIFKALTGDPILETASRKERKEGPRFLNQSIFLRGDSSIISGANGSWRPEEDPDGFTSKHIHLNNITFNIGQNSPDDQLTLAFSVVDKDSVGNGEPEFVKILIEFFRNEVAQETGFARAEIYIDGTTLTNNRYRAFSFPISDLITSPDFTATQISVARVFSYIAVLDGSALIGSDEHYVALDGFRIDNTNTQNPLYKMVGYSPVKTIDETPIIKFNNTNNYVEFRFGLNVT